MVDITMMMMMMMMMKRVPTMVRSITGSGNAGGYIFEREGRRAKVKGRQEEDHHDPEYFREVGLFFDGYGKSGKSPPLGVYT